MGLLKWVSGQGKQKKAQQEALYQEVENMFPTLEYVHAVERMREMLPQGDLNPNQYQWLGKTNPYQLSPPQWVDMMATQEGLTSPQVSQLHSDYYNMNKLPDVMNTPKNIDILIKAASFENYEDYE